MERKLAVVGAGTAGLITAAHLCTWLDNSWQVYLVHNPGKRILGIGESTNGAFINVLERATNFSFANAEDLRALDATMKYGSKFVGWRDHEWVNPLLNGNVAIHFDTRQLKDFVTARLAQNWPDQFRTLEADVRDIKNYSERVTLVTDQGDHDFDYVVDCMGAPPSFSGYTLSDCTLIDRCLIHSVKDYRFEPYTDHIATQSGWMFGVPLGKSKTYGYLYNHSLTDDRSAAEDMCQLLGVSRLEAGSYDSAYSFQSYYANELISGRVAKNGNRALFFEPLLANSIFVYIYAARLIFDHLAVGTKADQCNVLFSQSVRQMEDVISYYYKGGSTFDSKFWRAAAEASRLRLEGRREFKEYLGQLRDLTKKGQPYGGAPYAFSPHTWQLVDAQLGYRTFEPRDDGA